MTGLVSTNAAYHALVGILLLASWGVARPGLAQAPDPSPAPSPASEGEVPDPPGDTGAVPFQEVRPRTFYVRDASGKLVPVLGDLTFDDFERLYRLDQGLARPDALPRYSLTRLAIAADVAGDQAGLEVRASVLSHADDWVKVPLWLAGGALRDMPTLDGGGEFFFQYEAEGEGYVAYVRGAAGKSYTLAMRMVMPLRSLGSETRLELKAPPATTSEMKLTIPLTDAHVTVSEGASVLSSQRVEGGRSEVTVLGIQGDAYVAWQSGRAGRNGGPPVLQVQGDIQVRVEGPQVISTESQLRISGWGDPVSRFQLRLPPGANLVPRDHPDYVLAYFDPPGDDARGLKGRLVDVRLRRPASGPVDVTVISETVRRAGELAAPIEVGTIEVVGALRQSGEIKLATTGDWLVTWTEGPALRRLSAPADPPRQGKLVAAFEYLSQPASLEVRILPKTTRVRLEPLYVLRLEKDQVLLEADLRYKVRGARASTLEVDLAGWQLEDLGPEEIVQMEAIGPDAPEPLVIPLARPLAGDFAVRLVASRRIAPGEAATELSLDLPRPRAAIQAPATIVVVPADNVQVTPLVDLMPALAPAPLPSDLQLPPSRQAPLCYRDSGEDGPLAFASVLKTLPRSIQVDVAHHVRWERTGCSVRQVLSYEVEYEPVYQIPLRIPAALVGAETVDVRLDGQPLISLKPTDFREAGADAGQPLVVPVNLATPRIGLFELTVEYGLPLEAGAEAAARLGPLPLVEPGLGEITRCVAYVTSPAELELEPAEGGPWVRDRVDQGGGLQDTLALVASGPADALELTVRRVQEPEQTFMIDRAWIQTWLTTRARQDRAVFDLTTNQDRLELAFPAGILPETLFVLRNGQLTEWSETPQQTVALPLPPGEPGQRHVIELSYGFDRRPALDGAPLQLPVVVGDTWIRRVVWHLVVPQDEHLVTAPRGMTDENQWRRRGATWERRPAQTQAEMETWVGGSQQQPPAEGVNQYVFSTFGRSQPVWEITAGVRTASRRTMVLCASGCFLVMGLIVLYFPQVRHPAALLVLAGVLGAGGFLYPNLALAAVQAAMLGVGLVVLAMLLHRLFAARGPQPSLVRGSSIVLPDARSSVLRNRRAAESSHTTTATAAVGPVRVSAPEARR